MASGQTMIHQQTSIPGTNAPQMQPQIQQQAQQPTLNNLTGLTNMNELLPINMMLQGNMQLGNMQQTQQGMPLQGTNAPQMQPQIQQQAQQPILNNLTGLTNMNEILPINMMLQGNMQLGNMQQIQQSMPLQGTNAPQMQPQIQQQAQQTTPNNLTGLNSMNRPPPISMMQQRKRQRKLQSMPLQGTNAPQMQSQIQQQAQQTTPNNLTGLNSMNRPPPISMMQQGKRQRKLQSMPLQGTNAPQMQPQIQQQAQQPILNNLTGLTNMNEILPINMMLQGNMQLGNKQQTQQSMPLQGTNAPQMQPQIQQQAQQTTPNNLTGLNSMNRPPPISMMQQGKRQRKQQSMTLQGMASLSQPITPNQVATINLANLLPSMSQVPMSVPPKWPEAPPQAALGPGPGHPGGPPQDTGPVGPGEARHMGSGAPPIENYHGSNPLSQVLGREMENLIPIQEDQNYQSPADRLGYQQQSYQVTPSNIRFLRSPGLTSTSMTQAPLQQNQQTSQDMQGRRMIYNNQQMSYPSSRNLNPGDHPTSPHVMSHGSQPPMQQNSGSHYPPASGSSVHHQPGFNQSGP